MMSVLFAGMTAFALGCALLQGNLSALSDALLTGGSDAVSLMLRLVGGLCLWSGAMEVAVQSGLTRALSQALLPITRRLFPDLPPDSPAMGAISMNLTGRSAGGWERQQSPRVWKPCGKWSSSRTRDRTPAAV